MKVTVDANILFACLIKDEQTRKTWFSQELRLYAPEFIIDEFLKYKELLRKKSGYNTLEFDRLLKIVISQVRLVPDKELAPFLPAAASLISDQNDLLYMACALKEDTIIWSNDKEFKKQARIKTKTTTEMIKEIGLV